MSKESSKNFGEYLFFKIEKASQFLSNAVDVQPPTHWLLAFCLWFVIVYVADANWLAHLLWLPWFWYCVICLGSPWRTGAVGNEHPMNKRLRAEIERDRKKK